MDVRILKTPHHLNQRIHLPDVAQELIPQPLARTRALHQPRNIHELNRGWHQLFTPAEFAQNSQPSIRHHDHPHIRVDRAKRVIRRLRLTGARHRVKKGRFTDVWKTYDTCCEHNDE